MARCQICDAKIPGKYPGTCEQCLSKSFKIKKWYPRLYRSLIQDKTLFLNFSPDRNRLLEVTCEFFTAIAMWKYSQGIWTCTMASPIISWMVNMNPAEAKIELAKRRYGWHWVEDSKASI